MAASSMKGSYTIEAAVIVPLCVWVIVIIISCAFYEYDSCSMWQKSYVAALRGEVQGLVYADQQQIAQESMRRYSREEIWWMEEIQCEAEADWKGVRTRMQGRLRVPVDGSLFQTLWQAKIKSSVDRLKPVGFIRACNKAESLRKWLQAGGENSWNGNTEKN